MHTKPDDRILETASKWVSIVMDMNVLLSQNNYFRFRITYPIDHLYKNNWLVNHKNQATLMKPLKNISTIQLGDSIVAGFLRYPNIWYKFFNERIINYRIGGNTIQNVLWRAEYIPLPQSLQYVFINCGTNNLDTDDSEKITDGCFCITLALKKGSNYLKSVINGIIPCDERNTARTQKSYIVNKLLGNKCTNYSSTDIHYLSPDGDWIR